MQTIADDRLLDTAWGSAMPPNRPLEGGGDDAPPPAGDDEEEPEPT
jgi:hypothetical protein